MSLLFNAVPRFAPHTSLFRLAADNGGPTGGGGEDESKANAELNTLPKAKARVAELDSQVASLTNARDQALTDQKNAEKARDEANEVARVVGLERDKAKSDLVAAQTQITTLTGERDKAQKDLQASSTNVTRLEKLCGVHGLNPDELPAAANDEDKSSGAALFAQYEALTGAEKTAFLRKNGAALQNYANGLQKQNRG